MAPVTIRLFGTVHTHNTLIHHKAHTTQAMSDEINLFRLRGHRSLEVHRPRKPQSSIFSVFQTQIEWSENVACSIRGLYRA